MSERVGCGISIERYIRKTRDELENPRDVSRRFHDEFVITLSARVTLKPCRYPFNFDENSIDYRCGRTFFRLSSFQKGKGRIKSDNLLCTVKFRGFRTHSNKFKKKIVIEYICDF